MAWTAPRTWVTGEVVTASLGNTHWRDDLRYLKGLDGVPTVESGLIIDNTGGDEYLQIPSLTTGERDALTPVNGMVIYNETTGAFNKYEAGAWSTFAGTIDHGALDGLADDDHTQYQKESLLTTQGDLPYATAASTWARLAKGTASQYLKMNSGATAPEWGTVATGHYVSTFVNNTSNGNQAITGVGFQPKFLIIACEGQSESVSIADGTRQIGLISEATIHFETSYILYPWTDASNNIRGAIASFDVDGFTITWSSAAATPPARTFFYIAFS